MDPDNGTIDHLEVSVVGLRNCIHQAIPHACLTPPIEPVICSRTGTVPTWQIAPGRPSPKNPKNTIQDKSVILTSRTWTALRQNGFNNAPLEIGQVVAHDPSSGVSNLESLFVDLRYN